MNQSEIEFALDLHQKAFGYLLECRASGHAGSASFDEATILAWRNPDTCIGWVTRHYDQLPAAFRPERNQITAFAQLLSSLFATSFSVSKTVRNGKVQFQVRALPTRRLDGSRKSDHAEAREAKAADTLRQHALNALAAESGGGERVADALSVSADSALSADLTLWTYAVQLVKRTHFRSQGPAVYRLWLELPEKTRRNLSADLVWGARGRLVQHLESFRNIPIS